VAQVGQMLVLHPLMVVQELAFIQQAPPVLLRHQHQVVLGLVEELAFQQAVVVHLQVVVEELVESEETVS
jgi:hypothetical protein